MAFGSGAISKKCAGCGRVAKCADAADKRGDLKIDNLIESGVGGEFKRSLFETVGDFRGQQNALVLRIFRCLW